MATAASTAAFPTTVTADVTPARPASHGLEANASISLACAVIDYILGVLAVTPLGMYVGEWAISQ